MVGPAASRSPAQEECAPVGQKKTPPAQNSVYLSKPPFAGGFFINDVQQDWSTFARMNFVKDNGGKGVFYHRLKTAA